MVIIPGFLIAWLTFPGVIIHEAAHLLFCKQRKVAVFDVKFFQFSNKVSGYVLHENVDDFTTSFLICLGPFFVNTILCMLICFPVFLPYRMFGIVDPLSWILLWLGVSIGMHAFPSNQDASNLLEHAKSEAKKKNPLAIVSFPLVGLIFVANVLRVFWLDYAYGLFIGLFLPEYVFKHWFL